MYGYSEMQDGAIPTGAWQYTSVMSMAGIDTGATNLE
jgi:hypothetical protein